MLDERFVRAYVAEGSGLDPGLVIPANANAPTPTGGFATVLLVTDDPTGHTFSADLRDGDERAHAQYRVARYSVQFLGDGAPALASRLCIWAGSDAGLLAMEGALRDAQGGWPDTVQARVTLPLSWRRMDAIDDADWETRALVTLPVQYVAQLDATDTPFEDIVYERFRG